MIQRWLNRDPIGERGGLNLYGYVRNSPVSGIDPFGLTTVVSPTPLPGESSECLGPYTKHFDDGSDKVKPLHKLDPNDLFNEEADIYRQLQDKNPLQALNPLDEAGFDTKYFVEESPNREYYEYDGEIFADNEIDYFGIGMYERWAGDPFPISAALTRLWKLKYGTQPNPATMRWLRKGYDDYDGFKNPRKPLPKNSG